MNIYINSKFKYFTRILLLYILIALGQQKDLYFSSKNNLSTEFQGSQQQQLQQNEEKKVKSQEINNQFQGNYLYKKKLVRQLVDDSIEYIFYSCSSNFFAITVLPSDFQSLSYSTFIQNGNDIDYQFNSACDNILQEKIQIYFLISETDGENEYCELSNLSILNQCENYNYNLNINTLFIAEDQTYSSDTYRSQTKNISINIQNNAKTVLQNIDFGLNEPSEVFSINFVFNEIEEVTFYQSSISNVIISKKIIDLQNINTVNFQQFSLSNSYINLKNSAMIQTKNVQNLIVDFFTAYQTGSNLQISDYGIFYLPTFQNIKVSNSVFEKTISPKYNSFIYIPNQEETSGTQELYIENCDFIANQNNKQLINAEFLDYVEIKNVNFIQNIYTDIGAVYLYNTNEIYMSNINFFKENINCGQYQCYGLINSLQCGSFTIVDVNFTSNNSLQKYLGFYFTTLDHVNITNIHYEKNIITGSNYFQSLYAFAAYITQMNISNMTAIENYCDFFGIGIEVQYAGRDDNMFQINGANFTNNYYQLGEIYMTLYTAGQAKLSDIVIKNSGCLYYGLITMTSFYSYELNNVDIIDSIGGQNVFYTYKGEIGKITNFNIQNSTCSRVPIYSKAVSFDVNNLSVFNSTGTTAGALYADNFQSLTLQGLNFTMNNSTSKKAFEFKFLERASNCIFNDIEIKNPKQDTSKIFFDISNCSNIQIKNFKLINEDQFTNPKVYQGLIRIDSQNALEGNQIQIENIHFSNYLIEPLFVGISISNVFQCQDCYVKNITFTNLTQKDYSSNTQNQLFYIQIIDNFEFSDIQVSDVDNYDIISLSSIKDIIIKNIIIKNCKNIDKFAFSLTQSQNINVENFTISEIFSDSETAVIFESNKNLNLKHIHLSDLVNTQFGPAAMSVIQTSTGNFNNVTISNSISNYYPALYLIFSEYFEILDLFLINNTAYSQYGALYSQSILYSNIQNLKINSNKALNGNVGAIYLQSCIDLTIKNSEFLNNSATEQTGAIQIIQSENLNIYQSQIESNSCGTEGGGIFIEDSNQININETSISHNTANLSNGGGIHVTNTENFLIFDCQINDNKGFYAAGVSLHQSTSIQILQTYINNNLAIMSGGGIYIERSANIQIQDTEINYNKAEQGNGGGIHVILKSSEISIEKVSISENHAELSGGAVYIDSLDNFTLKNSQINNNFGKNTGSAIMLQSVDSTEFDKLTFKNNRGSQQGGAIYTQNGKSLLINQVDIQNSYSTIQGGALYISNYDTIDIYDTNFDKNYIESQIINNDYLSIQGGTIFADEINKFKIQNSNIKNTRSYFLGGAIYFNNINDLDLQNLNIKNATVFSEKLGISENQKSIDYILSKGGGIYYSYDQNQKDAVKITIKNVILQDCKASSGGGILIKNNQQQSFDLNFQNNTYLSNSADLGPAGRFLGTYSDTQKNMIKKEQNSEKNKGYLEKNEDFYFGFYKNEMLLDSITNEIQLCSPGYFLKYGGEAQCEECLSNGICEGGYIFIYPKQEYWREDDSTTEFYYCSTQPDVCEGQQCQDKYSGVLCEDCDPSQRIYKESIYCIDCVENDVIIVYQIFKIIGLVLFTIGTAFSLKRKCDFFLVKKAIQVFKVVLNPQNQLSIVLKIFVAHFQILALGTNFSNQIPSNLQGTVNYFGNPVSSLSYSIECLFNNKNTDQPYKTLFEAQLIGYFLGVVALFFTFLSPFFLYYRKIIPKSQIVALLISISICYFINTQTGLFHQSLQTLNCVSIGNTSYSQFQSTLNCSDDYYQYVLLPFHLLLIILLAIIFPFLIMLKIIKYKQDSKLYDNLNVVRSFGVFYIELKPKFFFWEFVWMYMKLFMALLANYFRENGTNQLIKVNFLSIIVITYAFLIKFFQPYQSLQVNKLAVYSSLVQGLTFLLGYTIVQDNVSEGLTITGFFIIILFNFLLLCQLVVISMQLQFRQYLTLLLKIPIPFIQKKVQHKINLRKKAQKLYQNLRISLDKLIELKKTTPKENHDLYWATKKPYATIKLTKSIEDLTLEPRLSLIDKRILLRETLNHLKQVTKQNSFKLEQEKKQKEFAKELKSKKQQFHTFNMQHYLDFESKYSHVQKQKNIQMTNYLTLQSTLKYQKLINSQEENDQDEEQIQLIKAQSQNKSPTQNLTNNNYNNNTFNNNTNNQMNFNNNNNNNNQLLYQSSQHKIEEDDNENDNENENENENEDNNQQQSQLFKQAVSQNLNQQNTPLNFLQSSDLMESPGAHIQKLMSNNKFFNAYKLQDSASSIKLSKNLSNFNQKDSKTSQQLSQQDSQQLQQQQSQQLQQLDLKQSQQQQQQTVELHNLSSDSDSPNNVSIKINKNNDSCNNGNKNDESGEIVQKKQSPNKLDMVVNQDLLIELQDDDNDDGKNGIQK